MTLLLKEKSKYKLGERIGCPHCNELDVATAMGKGYKILHSYKTNKNIELEDKVNRHSNTNRVFITEDRICDDCREKYSFEVEVNQEENQKVLEIIL